MRLVLVRHGEPDYEHDCLTEKGKKQAEIVARRLMKEGIEEIYSSPLGRARQTAEPFAELSGIGKVQILDFMREIRYGREDALYKSGNPWTVAFDLVREGYDLQSSKWREYPGYEENTAVTDADKVRTGTDEWLASIGFEREGLYYRCTGESDTERSLALFSHGGSSTAFMSQVMNIPFPKLCVLLANLQHTSVTILSFDSTPGALSMPFIELACDVAHLEEE
ncbi:MAG: histidine phosphatase family protein [Lachnospiraceae bacterium]|nr:histidine phosphatase family protein [Lachnospiraceae bacterium]